MSLENITHEILESGEKNYIGKHNLTISKLKEVVDLMIQAIGQNPDLKTALHKLFPDPTDDMDAANKRWVLSQIVAQIASGGTAESLQVTLLNVGTVSNGHAVCNVNGKLAGKEIYGPDNRPSWPNNDTVSIGGLQLIHSTNGYIKNTVEHLYLFNEAAGKDIYVQVKTADGSVDIPMYIVAGSNDNESYIRLNYGESPRLLTREYGVDIIGALKLNGEDVPSRKVYQDLGTSTLARAADITEVNRFGATAATYTIDNDTFKAGDKIVMRRLVNTAGVITITTDEGVIKLPNGSTDTSVTMSDKAFTCTLHKTSSLEWFVEIGSN